MATNFALAYGEVVRKQEALQLTGHVLEARKKTLGDEHPENLGSIHALAIYYHEARRLQEELQLTEQLVEARKKALGDEHPDTLGSIDSLAIRYSEAGRRLEELQLTEQVVEATKRTLGDEHPDTLSSIHALAICYSEAVEARKRTLGEKHRDTFSSIHSLAIRRSEAGRQQEELQLTKQVVETSRMLLSDEKHLTRRAFTLSSTHTLAQHSRSWKRKMYFAEARFWKKLIGSHVRKKCVLMSEYLARLDCLKHYIAGTVQTQTSWVQ
ncbi:hypothetical protein MMC29_003469, partial [Sticta canariensis]|nr:hypothetical protein [Sticta canariensis]